MATYNKRRVYSNYDILLNGNNVGNVTVAYHYGLYGNYNDSFFTIDLLLNNALKQVKDVQIAQEWQTYTEQSLISQNSTQAENTAMQLINKIILNHSSYKIELAPRRHAFDVLINSNGLNFKLVLIHEFYCTPQFKQAIILPANEYKQYGTDADDNSIIKEIYDSLVKQ